MPYYYADSKGSINGYLFDLELGDVNVIGVRRVFCCKLEHEANYAERRIKSLCVIPDPFPQLKKQSPHNICFASVDSGGNLSIWCWRGNGAGDNGVEIDDVEGLEPLLTIETQARVTTMDCNQPSSMLGVRKTAVGNTIDRNSNAIRREPRYMGFHGKMRHNRDGMDGSVTRKDELYNKQLNFEARKLGRKKIKR